MSHYCDETYPLLGNFLRTALPTSTESVKNGENIYTRLYQNVLSKWEG